MVCQLTFLGVEIGLLAELECELDFTFFPVEEVIVVLHADELVPSMLVCNILERLEFPSVHLELCQNGITGYERRDYKENSHLHYWHQYI